MYKITVPATSANIGSGFDSSGIALRLYNTVYFEESDSIDILSLDDIKIPTDSFNLVFYAAKKLFEIEGRQLNGLMLRQRNNIPMTRGLGSSSACIVAGLLGANALLNNRFTRNELMNIAASIEGHPDNVIPAFSGGFSTSVISHEGNVETARFDIEQTLCFIALIPPFELPTTVARSVIPTTVLHSDAVFNLSRSGLLTAAFASKDYRLLKEASKDRLHQPYRLELIEGSKETLEICEAAGALATYISGAGSSIMTIVASNPTKFKQEIEQKISENPNTQNYRSLLLTADNTGAVIESVDETIEDLRFIVNHR
ncbi:MAG: homoserine kinase [Oscillospiraceae bacterium]|nr:homoserine kinase [Oscillospiraceae bacterium]